MCTAQIEAISAIAVVAGKKNGKSYWQNGEKLDLGQNRAEIEADRDLGMANGNITW